MKIACLVIDFRTDLESKVLTLQLAASDHPDFEILVVQVDNGNDMPVAPSPEQKAAGVRVIRNRENRGYAGGVRGAIEALTREGLKFDAYWILNSDLEVEKNTLKLLADDLRRYPQIGAIGPRVMRGRSSKIWGERGVVSPMLGMTAMIEWPAGGALPKWSYIPGCSVLVRTEAYEQVGGMPDRYRLYYEETEMCVQLQKKGWELWVEPKAVVYHAVHSLKNKMPAPHFAFYFTRNNLYFWRRNFGIPWIVQLPRTLFVIFKEVVLPLRRSPSVGLLFHRLKLVAAGFLDGFCFLRRQYTYFEKKYFNVSP